VVVVVLGGVVGLRVGGGGLVFCGSLLGGDGVGDGCGVGFDGGGWLF